MRIAMCGECAREFEASDKGKLPSKCPDCKGGSAAPATKAKRAKVQSSAAESEEATPAFDVLATIATLQLDYCVGSAFRFIAEAKDGDELENLRTARTYLDAAIAAREAA